MDKATKLIAVALIVFSIYCIVFQTNLMKSIFDNIMGILNSIIEPVKNLIGGFT